MRPLRLVFATSSGRRGRATRDSWCKGILISLNWTFWKTLSAQRRLAMEQAKDIERHYHSWTPIVTHSRCNHLACLVPCVELDDDRWTHWHTRQWCIHDRTTFWLLYRRDPVRAERLKDGCQRANKVNRAVALPTFGSCRWQTRRRS